jgi:outer membrane protein
MAYVVVTSMVIATGTARASEEILTLSRALELGKERACSVKSARYQAASADANIDEQRAAYLPTLSASLTGGENATRDTQVRPPPARGLFAFVNTSRSGTGSTSLRWTAYDFGRTAGAVSAARASHDSAVEGVASAELGIMSDVANAYVTLYYREQLRDVARATLAQREERVDIAKGLIKSGLLPPLEEIRTVARADTARLDLITAEADVADARAALASLLWIDPSATMRIAPPRLPESDVDVATATRAADSVPSVRAATASARAKLAAADAAGARYWPTLSLSVDGLYRFSDYDKNPGVTNTRSAVGSILLSVPLLDFSIAPNLRGARADAASAETAAQEARRVARNEAERAALAARTTRAALVQARAAASENAALFTIVSARYKEGLSSPLELIDAESADSDARVALTQSELAHALALIRASIAIGRSIVEAP